ncbi:MAG: sugar phosphate isomerase/epimerase [Planctomycetota bacterium]|nr:MAG: sugar phosphate isomerase/epimerase [Planctomycetota bacterium]
MVLATIPFTATSPVRPSLCSIGFQTADKWSARPSVERPLIEVVDIAAHAGFAGIEVWYPHWSSLNEAERMRTLHRISAHGLSVPMLSAYYNFTKSAAHARNSLAMGHQVIRDAVHLGARNIRIFTGNHRSADASPEQWHRCQRCLQELCDAAAAADIGLCLETHDWNLMDTVEGTERLLGLVDRVNLGLIFQASTFAPQTWHWALRRLAPWVRHVHAPPGKESLSASAYDYHGQLSYLINHGFRGFVSLEYMGKEPFRAINTDGRWLINLCQRLTGDQQGGSHA